MFKNSGTHTVALFCAKGSLVCVCVCVGGGGVMCVGVFKFSETTVPIESKYGDNDQESIQSVSTPAPGHHIGK